MRTYANTYYIPSFSRNSYSSPGGVNLSQVESINIAYPNKYYSLKNGCHSGAGYMVKQGFINVNSADNVEKSPAITEEDDDNDSVFMPNLLKLEDVDSSDDDSDNESVGDNPQEVSG